MVQDHSLEMQGLYFMKFWWILQDIFIKHKPLISEEWIWIILSILWVSREAVCIAMFFFSSVHDKWIISSTTTKLNQLLMSKLSLE